MTSAPDPRIVYTAASGTPRGTLVILPGVNSGPYLFTGAAAALPEWHILAINPPGTAGVGLGGPFTVSGYAEYVMKVIKDVDGPVAVLGHSLGSFTAQELTRRLISRRRAPSHLVLVSSSPGQPSTTQDMARLQLKAGKAFWPLMREMEARPEQTMRLLFGSWPQRHVKAYQAFLAQRQQHAVKPAIAVAQLTAGGLFSSVRWVSQLGTVSTLVVHGADDVLVGPAGGRMLASLIPGARHLEYPDCGHFPMLEVPSFYADVAAFLESVPEVAVPVTPAGQPERRRSLMHRLLGPYARHWR